MLYKIVVPWRAIEVSESLSVEFVKPTTMFNGKLRLYCRTPQAGVLPFPKCLE